MSSMIASLQPEIVESFGYPLPKAYSNLYNIFVSMERIVAVAHGRNQRITFVAVSKNVMKNTKRFFSETHLSQIIGVYSESYSMRWEKSSRGKMFELIVKPNLADDEVLFIREDLQAEYKSSQKLDGGRLTTRKMIFRYLLVQLTKDAHTTFLQTRPELTLSEDEMFHPEFTIDACVELPRGKIPDAPEVDTSLKTMRDYLTSTKDPDVHENSDGNKTPTKSDLRDHFIPKVYPASENRDVKPKKSLLERIRERETSTKTGNHDSKSAKRLASLHLLKQSMVEVICDHYALKKVHGMNLRSLMPMVTLSCGKMDKERFMEHIDVLCEVAPTFCTKESFLSNTCLKLSEVAIDKILACVDVEINCLAKIKFEPIE